MQQRKRASVSRQRPALPKTFQQSRSFGRPAGVPSLTGFCEYAGRTVNGALRGPCAGACFRICEGLHRLSGKALNRGCGLGKEERLQGLETCLTQNGRRPPLA